MPFNFLNVEILALILGALVFLLIFKISKKLTKYFMFCTLGIFALIFLSSCSSGNLNINDNIENVEDNTLVRIKDIPFVKKSKIDIERSLILGEGKSWSGQIVLYVPNPKPSVFNFYVNNIEDFGWKEQTTIRGETSILNFVGDNNRVIIISVKEKGFNSSEVLISVSPYAEEFQEKVSGYINDKYLDIKDWKEEN